MFDPRQPAPVIDPRDRRPAIAAAASRKKTGLIPAVPGSDHMMVADGRNIIVRTRANFDAHGRKVAFVCLHAGCRGGAWPTFDAMEDAHPKPGVMRREEQVHVYAIWCDEPTDAAAVPDAKRAVAVAEAARKRVKTIDPTDETVTQEAWDAYERMCTRLDLQVGQARARLSQCEAPIGLIAAESEPDPDA